MQPYSCLQDELSGHTWQQGYVLPFVLLHRIVMHTKATNLSYIYGSDGIPVALDMPVDGCVSATQPSCLEYTPAPGR